MDAAKLKEKASEAFTKGKFAKAAEFYEEYCEKDPKDLQARLRMGDAFAKSNNKPRAIKAYTSAAEAFAKEGFLPRAIAASKLILELDPAHQGVQQMLADLYARKTGKPPAGPARPGLSAGAVATAMQTPQFNRKTAIDLPPDTRGMDTNAPLEASAAPAPKSSYDVTPSPMNRRDAIELPPDDSAPADDFIETVTPAKQAAPPPPPPPAPKPAEQKAVVPPPPAEEISIELEASTAPATVAPAEAALPVVEIVEESSDDEKGPGKVFDLSLDDTGGIDLSNELPLELQVGMTPTPASAASHEPARSPVPAPSEETETTFELDSEPAAPPQSESSGMELEIDFTSPRTDAPPPKPAEAKPAPAMTPAPGSRIWMPTSSDAQPNRALPAEPAAPPRAAPEYNTAASARRIRTDIEATLEAFSRFEELDAEPLRPAPPPPPPPLRASAPAAKPIPPPPTPPPPAVAPATRSEAKPPRRLSFTELELEGDSLLHAVETAAQVGQSQRGEEAQGTDDDIVYTIDDAPNEGGLTAGELPKIPLFSDLEPEAFIELFDKCPLRRYTTADHIFEQGSIGDSFFVICAGAVKVFRVDGGQRRDLATLKEGTFFGEMALLSGSPRTASVEAADEDTQLLEISGSILTELSSRYPAVSQALKKFMRQRLLSNVMNSSALFSPFSKGDRRTLVEKFRARDVAKGDVLIREGERSDGLYILLSGEVEVKKGPQLLARLKEGEIFGEMSLLQKTAATATVLANKRTSLLRLPRESFDALILTHPQILMLVSDLTDARKKETEALLSGNAKIGDEGLMLV